MVTPSNPRSTLHHILCVTMASLLAVGPVGTARGEAPAEEGSRLEYVVPGACAVVVLRPQQIFAAEALQMLPLEVIQAVGLKELGLDPLQIKQLVASVVPPTQGPPTFALHATSTQAFELRRGQINEHTAPGELNGRAYLQSHHPLLPSFIAPDNKSLLVAPDQTLQLLLGDEAVESPLAAAVSTAAAGDDLYARIDLAPLQPLIGLALMQVPDDFPAEAEPLLEIPSHLQSLELTVNVSNGSLSELVAMANSEQDAKQIEAILEAVKDDLLAIATTRMKEDPEVQRMLASDDPVEQAMGRYMQRVQAAIADDFRNFKLTRDGASFHLVRIDPEQLPHSQLVSIATIGVLVALLLPAVQAAREAARRASASNGMKQLLLGLLVHEQAQRSFPAHASYSDDGQPLLSWRVHILPYLAEQSLYDQFRLDEPWDSEHNKALIPKMPAILLDPSSGLTPAEGRTHFLGVQGEGMLFDGSAAGRKIRDIRDGTAKTLALVQVNDERAAIWTQPDDWQLDAGDRIEDLGGLHPGIFLVGFCDGRVEVMSSQIDPTMLQALLTIAGGEVANLNDDF